ncbi:MAG: gamma-glutamylcyclotransferase [Enterocloster citroniae]|nr:gamma-glutamylcyclotransferase [Enterocloster citroniae]
MEKRYYIAYGSNLNIPQMRTRCPGARIIGTSVIEGYRLLFKGSRTGSYLTIEPKEGASVPVAAWEVSAENEAALDRYEGFPTFYYKKEMELTLKGIRTGKLRRRKVFVYIMHEERPLGIPTGFYIETCRQGYRSFGFDEAFLEQAYADSAGGAQEFPGGWRTGDACFLVTNREKGCTGTYTVRGFDGRYFTLGNRRGSVCRASAGRMFRSREAALGREAGVE